MLIVTSLSVGPEVPRGSQPVLRANQVPASGSQLGTPRPRPRLMG